jgi:hypothetical protein
MTFDRAVALGEKLLGTVPLHASPSEHQATPDFFVGLKWNQEKLHGNFDGWIQYRKTLDNECVKDSSESE